MTNLPNEAIKEVSESPSEVYTPIDSNLQEEDNGESPDLRPTIFAQPPSQFSQVLNKALPEPMKLL